LLLRQARGQLATDGLLLSEAQYVYGGISFVQAIIVGRSRGQSILSGRFIEAQEVSDYTERPYQSMKLTAGSSVDQLMVES
jgi:hypothetical protein